MSKTVAQSQQGKTPKAVIKRVVQEATGDTPSKQENITRGGDNEVFRVETHDGPTYVVRVRFYGDVPLAQEAWALDQARQVGVPVPQVHLVTEKIVGDLPRECMVQDCVSGVPLDELVNDFTAEQRERAFAQAGEALAKIHKIPVGGFYRRHTGGIWDFMDWESLMEAALRDRHAEETLLRRYGVPADDVTLALSLLERYRDEFPCPQPVLCHGDFHPSHLLVDPETANLTSILDFGEFQGGPAVHDLAYWTMECPQIPLDWLKAGYGAASWWDDASFPRRLLLHRTLLLLGNLAYFIREGWSEDAAYTAAGLCRTLGEWRNAQ